MTTLRWQTFLVYLIFSLLLIFLDSQKYLSPVRDVAQVGLTPIESGIYSLRNGIGDYFSFLTFWRSGEARIKNLEQRNLELTVNAQRVSDLEKENAQLHRQLGVTVLRQKTQLPVQVLGLARYLLISKGSRDNISVGDDVVYQENLVGKVVRVAASAAYVALPTDTESKIPVKVGSSGEVKGLVIGQFGSALKLTQVAQTEVIEIGDLVRTTGEEEGGQPDLIMGKVVKITSKSTDVFKEAEIDPLIRFDKLNLVFVVEK